MCATYWKIIQRIGKEFRNIVHETEYHSSVLHIVVKRILDSVDQYIEDKQ